MSRFGSFSPILFVLLLLQTNTFAEEIDNYHTTITVKPSGSLHIREDILYDLGSGSKHGIFRDIPLMIKTDRYAKETPLGLDDISTEIDGKPAGYQSRTIDSRTGGRMLRLKIGDPNHTLTGKHSYTIRYTAARGVYPSKMKGMDAIRWNAVGSGSNIPTRAATADLILPYSLGRNNVKIASYTGRYGSADTSAKFRWIDEHHVHFTATDLAPHEAFTIEANFPKGILGQSGDELQGSGLDRLLANWHWGAIVGFLLFLWNYAKKFGVNEDPGSPAPQYYPPKGLSLLQSGLIIDKFADRKDFSAAVLELGSLGYLEIDNTKKPSVVKKRDPKANDSDLTLDQKYIMDDILFSGRSSYTVDTNDRIKAERMDQKLGHLNKMLYDWSVASGQMRTDPQSSRSKFLLTSGIIGALLIMLALFATVKYFGVDGAMLIAMGSVFVGVGAFVLMSSIRTRAWSGIFFGVMWLGITLFGFGNMISETKNLSALLASPIILVPVVALSIWYFYKKVGIFTQKGLDTYRYLLGYEEFIKRVEKDKIKLFLKKDPLYLDRTLPYAVLFGVSKHWLKLYDELNVAQPMWYYGDLHHVDSFDRALQTQGMPPISESGGFSGGGGFAGGGGGGGGVGSW